MGLFIVFLGCPAPPCRLHPHPARRLNVPSIHIRRTFLCVFCAACFVLPRVGQEPAETWRVGQDGRSGSRDPRPRLGIGIARRLIERAGDYPAPVARRREGFDHDGETRNGREYLKGVRACTEV